MAADVRRLRRRVPRSTSRTRGSSRAPHSCTTLLGWTLLVGAIFPLARAVRPRSQCRRGRVCDDVRGRRRDALLRPRRRADLRAHLVARGRAAPMKRAAPRRRCCSRSRFPAQRVRARDARARPSPGFQQRLETPPRTSAPLRPVRSTALPRPIEVFSAERRRVSGSPIARRAGRLTAPLPRLRNGRVHGALARDAPPTATSAPASTLRRPRRRRRPRPRRSARPGRRGPTTSRAGRTSSRSPCSSARSASALLVLRDAAARALSTGSTRSRASAGSRRSNVGIAAFVLRADDALQLPFVDLLYGDLSPIATKTRFGVGVRRDDARLRARHRPRLARLAPRPAATSSGPAFLVALGFASGPLALGALRPSSRTRRGCPSSPTGCTSSAAILWVGGLVALARVRLAARAGAAAVARSSASRGSRPSRRRARARRHLPLDPRALPTVSRPLDDALRPRPARQDRDRLRRAQPGAAAHHFFVRPRLERGDDAARAAPEPDRREHGRACSCCSSPRCSSTAPRRRRRDRRRGLDLRLTRVLHA